MKNVLIVGLLILIAVPYFLNLTQDLFDPVCHDEAAFHLNAKDLVLFGFSSLENDRLTSILFPLNNLIGLISFSFFGPSLLSIRIPYILLNVLGNLLFFDLIRRTRGPLIAVITTMAFAFYAPRFIMGKGAMTESLALPLLLILMWSFCRTPGKPRVYFWIGVLGMLIFWTKIDNIFVPAFLTLLAGLYSFGRWRENNIRQAKKISFSYLTGAGLIAIIWLGFYTAVGWEKVNFAFSYIFKSNTPESPMQIPAWLFAWQVPLKFSPLTIGFFTHALKNAVRAYPGLVMVTGICLVPFLLINLFCKKERTNALSLAIWLILALFVGKLLVTRYLFPRRLAVCYPLPFLLLAHTFGFSFSYQAKIREVTGRLSQRLKSTAGILAKVFSLLCLGALIYLCYRPYMHKIVWNLVTSPRYRAIEESRAISAFLNRKYKAIFLNGCFAYIALESPMKFIDIPPDLEEMDFYRMESNPTMTRKLIYQDPDIAYVFFRQADEPILRMVEDEFHGKRLGYNIAGGPGVLYYLPPRNRKNK